MQHFFRHIRIKPGSSSQPGVHAKVIVFFNKPQIAPDGLYEPAIRVKGIPAAAMCFLIIKLILDFLLDELLESG